MSFIYLEWCWHNYILGGILKIILENVIWDILTYTEYRGKNVTTMDILCPQEEGVVVSNIWVSRFGLSFN